MLKIPQWFIITVIGGKEDSIVESLREKINNFGYSNYVTEIKVFKTTKVTEEVFTKTDPKLPKTLKNTKTTKWETLPNGSYKRTKTKIANKFPGYVFVKMENLDEKILHSIWFCIRNTNGVLGFVGSSGKGALPIPVSIQEYENIIKDDNVKAAPKADETTSEAPTTVNYDEETGEVISTPTSPAPEAEPKKVYTCDYKVGNTVKIVVGAFEGEVGEVKSIDLEKGKAIIQIEIFGRVTSVEVNIGDVKVSEE